MGNKKTHPPSEFEITTLAKQTGLDAFTVRGLSTEFAANSKNGLMNKRQFQKIYSTLTPGEDPESSCKLKRLSNRVFKAFDKDNSGTLSFDEFVAAYYMLKTQGKSREKMEFLLKQIVPRVVNLNEVDEQQTLSVHQAQEILHVVDEGLGVNRSAEAFQQLPNQKSPGSGPLTVQALVNSVVSDPVYHGAMEKSTAEYIMADPGNDF